MVESSAAPIAAVATSPDTRLDETGERARAAIAAAREMIADGDPLRAIDVVSDDRLRPARHRLQSELAYLRALGLARSGALWRASEELAASRAFNCEVDPTLAEESDELEAHILKVRAIRSGPSGRSSRYLKAAAAYSEIAQRLRCPIAAVNAATCWCLAGSSGPAHHYAGETLAMLTSSNAADDYWSIVTRAEALLVLDEVDGAADWIARAHGMADPGIRSGTLRQLRLLCDHLGVDPLPLLAPIKNPATVHFTGHIFAPHGGSAFLTAADETRLTAAVREALIAAPVKSVHGSLAAGADIVVAEQAIHEGIDVHVVLPFAVHEFIESSVAPAGGAWVDRFHRCLGAATEVTVACDSAFLGDDTLFGYASALAMGDAMNRADSLCSAAWQLAVWDGVPTGLPAGTAHDVELWRSLGQRTEVISVARAGYRSRPKQVAASRGVLRSFLFGELLGCSDLHDEHLQAFADHVLRTIDEVLTAHGSGVSDRNFWRGGFLVVLEDPATAATCALDLQESFAKIDHHQCGFPQSIHVRISAHAGPVLHIHDPLHRVDTVAGRELASAVRIEPRTPPGEVYATQAFAALLRLDPLTNVASEYVGRVTTAKDFETIPMFQLRRDEPE